MSSLPDADSLPDSILRYDQWVCWTEKERDGKRTKVPVDPHTGRYASATDPETWISFETARERALADDLRGLGFVFTASDPIVGVDLDDCRVPESGTLLDWAEDIVATLDSFTEVSPSGTGVHVLVEGSLPGDRSRKGDVEMYETARFFTVTGDRVDGCPAEIHERRDQLATVYDQYVAPETDSTESGSTATESDTSVTGGTGDAPSTVDFSDEALLSKARNAKNGQKFDRLWRGNTTGYDSQSEADMALCALLAFWAGSDMQRMDHLFRDSGLMRDKWDEVHFADGSTYGEKTVERAATAVTDHYKPDNASRNGRREAESDPEAIPAQSADSSEIGESEARSQNQSGIAESDPKALLESIQRLEGEVKTLRAENEKLRAELETERAARKAAEKGESGRSEESERNVVWRLLGW
jgi:primase-polymerase (primpol)-like protein